MKVKALLIGAFAGVGVVGAVGGTAAYLAKQQNNSSFSNSFNNPSSSFGSNIGSNYFNTASTNSSNVGSSPIVTSRMGSSFGEGIKSIPKNEIIGKNFMLNIQRQSHTEVVEGEEQKVETFKIKIEQDEKSKAQGQLYFVTEQNKDPKEKSEQALVQEVEFKPGDTLTIGVKYVGENEGDNKITIRDLLISGANENHFLKTEKKEDGTYTVKMPTKEEQTNKDGTEWFYGEKANIKVQATFIKESIGANTKWTHGAYFGDLNGYVYNLTEDVQWSTLKSTIYTAFDNKEDKKNPIDIYIFLNGYTFTIDENIDKSFVPSGWALHIHNNGTDSATQSNQYGKIKVKSGEVGRISIEGSLHLGRSVDFNSLPTIDGVGFVNTEDLFGWIGVFQNRPNQN